MQKISKKASILIYSIILSLMLWFIFISISNQININIKQNIEIEKNIDKKNKIDENLKKMTDLLSEIDLEVQKAFWVDYDKIAKNFLEIDSLKNIYDKDIEIELETKNELFELKNGEEIIFYIPPGSSVIINSTWEYLKYDAENMATWIFKNKAQNIEIWNDGIISAEWFFKKIILKNSWWYSKINIIANSYISSPKKYFQVFEKFWKKRLLRQSWFLQIRK